MKVVGRLIKVEVDGEELTFVRCPYCGALHHLTGQIKHHKVINCWRCGDPFVIE